MKLKEIRKQRKMSQAKLAEKLGVSRSTVSMWEIGASQPDNDNLLQLAQILNISLDVLLGNDASSAEDASYVLPVQIKRVPLLGNIACGEPIFAEEEHGEYIYTSDALDVDFCLRAQGDSMIGARIYDGDIVFVRRRTWWTTAKSPPCSSGTKRRSSAFGMTKKRKPCPCTRRTRSTKPCIFPERNWRKSKILGKAIAFQSVTNKHR